MKTCSESVRGTFFALKPHPDVNEVRRLRRELARELGKVAAEVLWGAAMLLLLFWVLVAATAGAMGQSLDDRVSGIITSVPARGIDLSPADKRLKQIETIDAGINAVRSRFGELADNVARAAQQHAASPSEDTAIAYLEATADAALRGAQVASGTADLADAGATVLSEQADAITQGISVLSSRSVRADDTVKQLRDLQGKADASLGTVLGKLASASSLTPAQETALRNAFHAARVSERMSRSGSWSQMDINASLAALGAARERQLERVNDLTAFASRTRQTAVALRFEAEAIAAAAEARQIDGRNRAMDQAGKALVSRFGAFEEDLGRLLTNGLPSKSLQLSRPTPAPQEKQRDVGLLDRIRDWLALRSPFATSTNLVTEVRP